MTRKQNSVAPARHRRNLTQHTLRMLLLVPEAPLILVLLATYAILGAWPWLGLCIALVIIGFLTRMLALLGAFIAYTTAHYREAETLGRIALALHPWSADTLALCGTIALARRQADQAELLLRRATQLQPERADFQIALSSALLTQGHPAAAAEAARTALRIAPNTPLAQLYLAEAERASGMPVTEVEERLRAGLAVATTPEAEAALRCALGTVLFEAERNAEAMLTIRGAEALLPRCTPSSQLELRVRLGELLIAQGQIERAREQFQGVAALDPSGRYTGAAWRASHLL